MKLTSRYWKLEMPNLYKFKNLFRRKKFVVQVFKGTVDNVPADVSKYAI